MQFLDEPTLSDGTAGGVESGCVCFPICCECVDEWVSVTEQEIADCVYAMAKHHHKSKSHFPEISLAPANIMRTCIINDAFCIQFLAVKATHMVPKGCLSERLLAGAVIEGAAGVALAGMLRLAPALAGKHIGVVICGNNIGAEVLAEIVSSHGGPKL